MRRAAAALLAFTGLCGALSAAAADEIPWPKHYGNAPDELVPFRKTTPYFRFFEVPQPFLGPGREYPAEAGLKALKVGLFAPAPNSYDKGHGSMMRRGVELALDEANEGRAAAELPFVLVVREDAPLWGSAANIMASFAFEDDVLAVIGTIDSNATHVALRVGLKAELLMVNTGSSDPTVTETNIPWILRTWPDDRQHGYRLAELVVKERGCKRIVVFRVNDRYGRTGIKIFNDSVRRLGAPVVQEMRFLPGDRSFATQVERIRSVGPDAVVFWGEPDDVGRAAAAVRAAGITAPFFGPDRLLDPEFVQVAGPAAEGTTITAPLDPAGNDPEWKRFAQKFEKRWGQVPDAFGAYAYDGARILFSAIRKTGPNRFLIRDAVMGTRSWNGAAGNLVFDQTGNNVVAPKVFRVRGGIFVLVPQKVAAR
jgi:branched-chain amino acid transport system substrate-binding protein